MAANLTYGILATAIPIVLISIVLAQVFQNIRKSYFSPVRKIPGPWYSYLTNFPLKLAVITGRRIHYVHALHLQYGPIVRISPTEIAIADPESFKTIHRINSGFNKSIWYEKLNGMGSNGIFAMREPKEHATRRKMLARAFSKTYLRQNWEPVVVEKVKLAVTRIKDEAKQTGTVDVLKWWTFLATDVSGHLMFGESFRMLELGQKTQYIRVLEATMKGSGIATEIPLVRTIGKHLPISSIQTMFSANNYLLNYGKQAVKIARATDDNSNIFRTIIQEADYGEGHLTDADVCIEASNLIVAGSDTTSITLTYLTWAVLMRPVLRAALEEEVQKLNDGFTETDLEELPLLNAVIEETLRLYGAAPGGLPRIVPPGGATLAGYFIPEGTTVTTQSYTLHRDPGIFHSPDSFDPTRWFSNKEMPEVTKSVYSPFGSGARICIGMHLARMELRLAAATFFRECRGAKLAPLTTPDSMEMENYFLIAPRGHKCEIII